MRISIAIGLTALATTGAAAQELKGNLATCSGLVEQEKVDCFERIANELAVLLKGKVAPVKPTPLIIRIDKIDLPQPVSMALRNPEAQATMEIAGTPPPPSPMVTVTVTPGLDNWLISEMTSPVDYSPIAIATLEASDNKLTLACRAGQVSMAISGKNLPRKGEYVVNYMTREAGPTVLKTEATVHGIAIKEDVRRLLSALPDQGTVTLRTFIRQDAKLLLLLEERYNLAALKAIQERVIKPCHRL